MVIGLSKSGANNPMFGKPSPNGSGNGWSGWYKGWFFRSLRELSFMINFIEKNGMKWVSAESKKYAIQYQDYKHNKRNYFADFMLNDVELIEVKPYKLLKSKIIQIKSEAAKIWCAERNFSYRIMTDKDFEVLTDKEVNFLIESGKIKFTDRYMEKYNARLAKIQK
jgi:hypothetical protein